MSATSADVRTLAEVGQALQDELPALALRTRESLSDSELASDPVALRSTQRLLGRFCMSLSLARPVGIAAWAQADGRRLGSAGALRLAQAVAATIIDRSNAFDVNAGCLPAFLDTLAGEVARGLRRIPSTAALVQASPAEESGRALLAMLAEQDMLTCRHSQATAQWTRRLCVAMGLSEEQIVFTTRCGLLHDIGKVGTPARILRKPGQLTAREWETMRDHSAAGARILDQIPSLQPCAIVVRAHHERWDGAGYPDRLGGEHIPFEARIVAVADAFQAMISERPFRFALAPRQALEVLESGSGSQWDREVVAAMLGLLHTSSSSASHARSNLTSSA
ncbi:MAG: HD-GYP domain-containing protein [Vulcanimicrobiaceae bacterium]